MARFKNVDGVRQPFTPEEETKADEFETVVRGGRKARFWEAIKAERARRRIEGGIFLASANKWFHSDDDARIQYLTLDATGASLPAGSVWKTMDGPQVTLTRPVLNELILAMATLDQALYATAKAARDTMNADPDAWDIRSIVWPPTFPG